MQGSGMKVLNYQLNWKTTNWAAITLLLQDSCTLETAANVPSLAMYNCSGSFLRETDETHFIVTPGGRQSSTRDPTLGFPFGRRRIRRIRTITNLT